MPRDYVEMVNNRPTPDRVAPATPKPVDIGNGDVLIAAITSCTNTSNPSVMLAAGLLAKKAVEKGLTVKPHVKTSLAPGSRVVTEYLTKTGLLPYLEQLGFDVAAYGCTTCIGNAGDLDARDQRRDREHDLVCAAVLSGNRNFEARIHPNLKANFLASPPLVVAYALAGTVLKDLTTEPLGEGKDGPVYLRDIWPTSHEVGALMSYARDPATFRRLYGDLANTNPLWKTIAGSTGQVYDWPTSTYIAKPPFFEDFSMTPGAHRRHPRRPRARHLRRLGHHRPHLAGRLDQADVAGRPVPAGARRLGRQLQQLRLAPRQPRSDDARHVRQRAHQEPDAAGKPTARASKAASRCTSQNGGRADADLRRRDAVPARRACRPSSSAARSTAPAARATGRPRARSSSASRP